MRTILLPFRDEDAAESAFATAAMVARQFGSYVEGLMAVTAPQMFSRDFGGRYVAVNPALISEMAKEWRSVADKARSRFVDIVERHGIPMLAKTENVDGPSADWREIEGREAEVVGDYGRLFDLIAVGRYVGGDLGAGEATIESALFESGRPVLVASRDAPSELGRTIVVAWNNSTETARTVALGMPLLAAAERVIVLSVEGWVFPGPPGVALAEHLVRGGVNATAETVRPNGRSNGETILAEALERGADLLLKGAYTHTRFRQLVFGGATRHVLTAAKLPLLMAH